MSNREIEYEVEGYTEDNPVDTVWVRDGRGQDGWVSSKYSRLEG